MAAIGVLTRELRIEHAHSLKEKRQVVKSLKDRLRRKFNVSIAEAGDHDLWQRGLLGIAQVGTDEPFCDAALREVVRFIDDMQIAELGEEQLEFLHY